MSWLSIVSVLVGVALHRYLTRRRRGCLHHDRHSRESWVKEEMIEMGMGKRLECRRCGQAWII